MHSHFIISKVNSVLSFEGINQIIYYPVVKIISTQPVISAGCQHFENSVTDFQYGYIEGSSAKVKNENPDAVYFAGYTEQGLMRKQMVQLGMTQKWLAAEATSSEYIDITGEAGIGTISATAAPPLDFRQEMIDFAKRFEAKYNKLPESWSSYYYDMVYAIADAITKANSDKREDIVQTLKKIDVPSVIYPQGLQFDSHGRVVHPVTFIYELGSDLKYKTIFVWQGTPPYQTMSEEEYQKIIESLK